jgi:hypothetical protein
MVLGAIGLNVLAWQWMGAMSLAICSPMYAFLLTRPILSLLSQTYQAIRALAFRRVSGRHFEHRGTMLDIVDDDAGHRWLSLNDVRKIIPGLPSAQSLLHRYPDGVRMSKHPAASRIQAETLARYLDTATAPDSLRFKHWLDREVVFPARQRRERS